MTVLFTDLVASTELLSRVGETAADELRREHFALLRSAIDETGGREVKNLGDGLMVAFGGVVSALSCAVAMQQAMTARPPSSEPMSIRVGVAVGEADVDGGDYFGLPVVQAARLCAKAAGGEILATDVVRLLARSRGGFDLESVGLLELKGLEEPVEGFLVRWEAKALAYASCDRLADATNSLDLDVAENFHALRDYNWAVSHSVWADAAARAGHVVAAEALYARLQPFAELVVSAAGAMRLSVAHYLGKLDHTLGRLDDGDERYREAMAIHERVGSTLYIAHTEAAWAMLLTERNRGDDRHRAAGMAAKALTAATAGGYGNVEHDARTSLDILG